VRFLAQVKERYERSKFQRNIASWSLEQNLVLLVPQFNNSVSKFTIKRIFLSKSCLAAPPLNIPDGGSAKFTITDNTFPSNIAVDNHIQLKVPGYDHFNIPSYASLIENAQGRKRLLDRVDLSLRKIGFTLR